MSHTWLCLDTCVICFAVTSIATLSSSWCNMSLQAQPYCMAHTSEKQKSLRILLLSDLKICGKKYVNLGIFCVNHEKFKNVVMSRCRVQQVARLTSFTGFATFNSFNSFVRLSSFTRFTSVKGGEAEKCESGCFATFYIVDWETGVLGVLVCRVGRHKGVLDVRRGVPLRLAPVLHTSELCTKVKRHHCYTHLGVPLHLFCCRHLPLLLCSKLQLCQRSTSILHLWG